MLRYPGIVHEDADGLWIEFPDFEISGTQGEDREELTRMAEDCIGGYLEYLVEERLDIPDPSDLQGDNIVYITVPAVIAAPIIIRKERRELGMSQGDVAEKMKTSYRTVQKVERMKSSPTLRTLSKIAKALNRKLIIDFK